jgi:hypothetical protein
MTEWIKHEPGPCPIPNAKAGEWEYKTAVNPTGWKAIADAKNYSTAWHHGTITHYRLLKPAVDWQAIADELASALKRIHPDPDYEDCVFAQDVIAKYQKAKGN